MIKISSPSSPASLSSEVSSDADDPRGTPAPQAKASLEAAPHEPAARQSSLEQRAMAASRTRLSTLGLSFAETDKALSPEVGMPSGAIPAPGHGVTALKNELYLPSKRIRAGFNAAVTLPAHEADSLTSPTGTTVLCRHLAFEYFNSPKKADFLNRVNSEEGVREYFSNGTLRSSNQGVNRLVYGATLHNTRVVSIETLPKQISHIARDLNAAGKSKADFLMVTGNHAMALNIQIKDSGRVCVTLYDPNLTTNHARIEARDFNDLDTLKQTVKPLLLYRREEGSHAFTLHAKDDMFTPGTQEEYLRPSAESTPAQVISSAINLALNRHDPTLARLLIDSAAREHPQGGKALKDTLAAVEDNFPGLYKSLLNGHSSTAAAWMEGVRNLAKASLLAPDELFELFRARGTSAGMTRDGLLSSALQGRAETISIYMAQVANAAVHGVLKKSQIKELLAAPDRFYGAAVNVLWQKRDHHSMQAVVQQLSRCYQGKILSGKDIKDLLQGRTPASRQAPPAPVTPDQLAAFTSALQLLVNSGALSDKDVKALFAIHGFVGKPEQSRLGKLFS